MPEKQKDSSRVRISYKVNSKGQVQPDITCEFPTVKEAIENLEEAIKEFDTLMRKNKKVQA